MKCAVKADHNNAQMSELTILTKVMFFCCTTSLHSSIQNYLRKQLRLRAKKHSCCKITNDQHFIIQPHQDHHPTHHRMSVQIKYVFVIVVFCCSRERSGRTIRPTMRLRWLWQMLVYQRVLPNLIILVLRLGLVASVHGHSVDYTDVRSNYRYII